MGTLTTWILTQAVPPGACCQTMRLPPRAARASAVPPGPGASAAVPGGSGGSGCQDDPALASAPWLAVVMIAVVPPDPNDADVRAPPWSGRGGDRVQWPPTDQAASRLAPGPVPACSSAVMPCGVRVRLLTVISCPARAAGRGGPAACQVPFPAVKMPTAPGRVQVPESTGRPAEVKVAAVRACSPQRRPAGVAARTC